MMSYWRFHEGVDQTASDFVDGRILTLGTSPGADPQDPVWVSGTVGGALMFDGVDDLLRGGSLPQMSEGTIEAWVNRTAYGIHTAPVIFSMFLAEELVTTIAILQVDASLGFAGPKSFFFIKLDSNRRQTYLNTPDYSWEYNHSYHLVATWGPSGMRFYINGVLSDSKFYDGDGEISNPTTDFIGSTAPIEIGDYMAYGSSGWQPFAGTIDEVAVYNRALTPAEVQQHYQNGLNGYGYCEQSGAVTAYFDIKPGSCPNPLSTKPFDNAAKNLNAKQGGVLPVAILGTAIFDVSEIDVSTVRLEGLEPLRYGYEDVTAPFADGDECECTTADPDGYLDLTLKFQKSEVVAWIGGAAKGDVVRLTVTGQLEDGTPFEGTDCVTIVSGEREDRESLGRDVLLHPAVPNPFNPTTTVSFTLPEGAKVTLSIYDVEGKLVRTLVDETVAEGYQEHVWDGKDASGSAVSSGVYFYRLTAGDRTLTKKMILLK
jgi:hypothetical protein